MKSIGKWLYMAAVTLTVLSLLTDEVDARRKVLQGRKVMTRTYYRGTAIPAWSIALLVGIGEVIIGAGLYLVMRKVIFSGDGNENAV